MDDVAADPRTPLLKPTTSNAGEDASWDRTQDAVDAEPGGPEARKELERKLLWKVDKRMSILVLIYILNFVRHAFVVVVGMLTAYGMY